MIGPWLKFFVCFTILRWNDVKYLKSNRYKYIYNSYNYKKFHKPFNTDDFNMLSNNQEFNSFIYSKIISFFEKKKNLRLIKKFF